MLSVYGLALFVVVNLEDIQYSLLLCVFFFLYYTCTKFAWVVYCLTVSCAWVDCERCELFSAKRTASWEHF